VLPAVCNCCDPLELGLPEELFWPLELDDSDWPDFESLLELELGWSLLPPDGALDCPPFSLGEPGPLLPDPGFPCPSEPSPCEPDFPWPDFEPSPGI